MSLDVYHKELETDKAKRDFDSFDHFFRVRLFYQKYRSLAQICDSLSWFFNLLSIAAGTLGVASLLAAFIFPNLMMMAVPAVLVLAITELIKRWLLTNWTKEKYRDGTINPGLLLTNILLIAGSGFATVYGGIEIVNMARDQSKPKIVSVKNIEQKYNAQVAGIKANQKKLIARNTYRNQTWLSQEKEQKYQKWEDDIRKLQAQKEKEITQARKGNREKEKEYAKGTNEYIAGFIALSLIIESLCIITLWFSVFYKHRSRRDKEVIEKAYAKAQHSKEQLIPLIVGSNLPIALHQNINSSPTPVKEQPENLNEPPKNVKEQGQGGKEQDGKVNEAPESQKVQGGNDKEHTQKLKEPPKNVKVQGEKVKEPPMLPFAGFKIPHGIGETLNPGSKKPIRDQEETGKEGQEAPKVPRGPLKRTRGTVLPYDKIDPLILEGKLSNLQIANQFLCGESTIVKRRGKLKKMSQKTINGS